MRSSAGEPPRDAAWQVPERLINVGFIAEYDSGHCTSCNQPIRAGEEIEEAHISSQVVRRYFYVRCAS